MTAIFGRGVTFVAQLQALSNFAATFPASGTWATLAAYEHSEGETRGKEADPLLGQGFYNGRDPLAAAPSLPDGGGQIQVPVCLRQFGYWLSLIFGAPVTTGGPNYVHTFESGKDTLQCMAYSKTLVPGSLYRRGRGLMIDTLAFNLTKESGYPRATLGAKLRDEVKATSAVSGTVDPALTLLRVPNAKPYVKRNGSAAPVTALSFNYGNQLERFDPLNGTEYPDVFDPGDATLGGSFTVRYEDATYDDLADADTAQPWSFGWAIDSNNSLDFTLNAVRISRQPLPVSGPGRLLATYTLLPEQTGGAPAVTATLKNDVSGYPPPPPPPPPPGP
jgi:hypothetical protein